MDFAHRILQSGAAGTTGLHTLDHILNWVEDRKKNVFVRVDEKPLSELRQWSMTKDGAIVHESGRFFAIRGADIAVKDGVFGEYRWRQPIIDQPEIGYLGTIAKEIDGILHFLVQAKIEPGNLNHIQLSPSLQATRSNFSRVHRGKSPKFLEVFTDSEKHLVVDQLQSEQGTRFLSKRNRNIAVLARESLPDDPDFIWMTLGQIKELLKTDNLINMDLRSVASLFPLPYVENDSLLGDDDESVDAEVLRCQSWMADRKMALDRTIQIVSLRDLPDYRVDDREIADELKESFRVMGCSIQVGNREIASWDQPSIQSDFIGEFCFFVRKHRGIYQFLVQNVLEPGLLDGVELGPTVHMSSDRNCNRTFREYLNHGDFRTLYDSMQSEEGGRFFREENRNMIVEVPEDFDTGGDERYRWMGLRTLNRILRFGHQMNVQARSLLSLIELDGSFGREMITL